jgi:uncharacterized protein (TIGR00297 family)
MTMPVSMAVGLVAAVVIAGIARWTNALSTGGAIAAAVLGMAAIAAGWDWAALLVIYFVASTALSKLGAATKARRLTGVITKPGPRDAAQVLANGLPFLIGAIAAPVSSTPAFWMALAAGSLAASAADTWATEIGTWVGQRPRSIVTGRLLLIGESGGITVAGSAAAIAGAAFVGTLTVALEWPRTLLVPVIVGGIAGAVIDSVLGALLQGRSWCDACEQPTEMDIHVCGTRTRHVAGVRWLGNDSVNLMATITGAAVAAVLNARAVS